MKIYPVLNYVLHHEDVWVSGGIAPPILNLDTRWRWAVSFMPWLLYTSGKNPLYQ